MDESEFRRRIEVYVETDLGDLAHDKERIARTLSTRLWPLVNGWRIDRDLSRSQLAAIVGRVRDECPELLARLSVEWTGSDTGWP